MTAHSQLSPTAQKIMDAWWNDSGSNQSGIAAVLRETVNQLKFFGITEKNILAIAKELEQI
jgi:hypothetical protein